MDAVNIIGRFRVYDRQGSLLNFCIVFALFCIVCVLLRMRSKQKQKDKMASWRKNLPDLPESLREEEFEVNKSSSDVSQAFSKRYSPASFDSYSPDNDKETDSSESDTGVSEQSEVCSAKRKK